jgi:septum site-determining protein MinC
MELSKSELRRLTLPLFRQAHWRETLPATINAIGPGPAEIDCRDWQLGCRELVQLTTLMKEAGIEISRIYASLPETIVSANALGYPTHLNPEQKEASKPTVEKINPISNTKLLFHQGTLRSGDHLNAEGDVLLVGDVNPGARISAGGNVMVWGRLRGIAHAGQHGNKQATIVAMQLRPLQLRIADAVARGPEEQPQVGLAEEARLEGDTILINPATTNPLNS